MGRLWQTALGVSVWAMGVVGVPARAEVPIDLALGYAYRLADPTVDDRLHGAAGSVGVAAPTVWGGFSARGDALLLTWPAGSFVERPLLFAGGAACATYVFDDTATAAVASLGAFGGAIFDGATTAAAYGPIAGLSVLFPIVEGLDVVARVTVPYDLSGKLSPSGTATIGLAVALDTLVVRASRGEGPAAIATDAGVLPEAPPPSKTP